MHDQFRSFGNVHLPTLDNIFMSMLFRRKVLDCDNWQDRVFTVPVLVPNTLDIFYYTRLTALPLVVHR